jgi:predicted sulfurtransferase
LDFGFSVSELVLKKLDAKPFAGKIGLRTIKVRKPHEFVFDTDEYDNLKPDGLRQSWTLTGKGMPIGKFLIFSYQREFGNEHWLGECFVFDPRMTVKVERDLVQIGRCEHSGRPTARFVNCLHDPCHRLFMLSEESESENADHRLCPECLRSGLSADTAEYVRPPKDSVGEG